jgi:ribose transport system ATP-binding protein
VRGKKVAIHSPKDAVREGIGYLSEDRKRFGVVLKKNITENSTLACLRDYVKHLGMVDGPAERKVTQKMVDALKTKTPGIDRMVLDLSGGNQQKVVVAKWLISNSDILIFDEPTRGIDVGAKQEIYELMNRLVREGKSIIMISSEMPEILRMSDRIVVMCEGKKTAEVDVSEATQEKIMNAATRDIAV